MKKTSVIPAGVTLVGDIEGDADLVVLGRVDGPIHVAGALVIEGSGQVRGHVRARTVTVRGVLKGDAYGERAVRVEDTARLVGELTAPRVQVAVGAQFRGQVHMDEVGEPRLSAYDPALHTFSGAPAPVEEPAPVEQPAPSVDDAPTLSEARPPDASGVAPTPAAAAPPAPTSPTPTSPTPTSPTPTSPTPTGDERGGDGRRMFRMPRLGRARGQRRGS